MGLFTWLFGTPAPRELPGGVAIMPEAEWLVSGDRYQMLVRVSPGQFTPRKHLLLACGCLRFHVEHDSDPYGVFGPQLFSPASNLPDWLTGAEAAADSNPSILEEYASGIPGQKAHWSVPREALAQVVRELFAYPFGPDRFCDEWLTTTVVALAESIDARRSFENMPVLGDALEEAGCTDEGVLWHCRHETYHLRGCWVLDSLLRRRAGCWRDLYRASDRARAAEIPPEKVRDLLRPREEFPGGCFLVGDEETGYVIAAWHPQDGLCTLRCADDPLYCAMTEHLLANGALRFSSSWEATSAHAQGRARAGPGGRWWLRRVVGG
jgi:hypothetical protein